MQQWITIGEAAQYLGLSVDKVRRLANEGTLRARLTPGGHRRFHIAVLDSYRKRKGQKARARSRRKVSPKPRRAKVPRVDPFLELVNDPDEWTGFEPPATPSMAEPVIPSSTRYSEPACIDSFTTVPERPNQDETLRLQTIKTSGLVAIPSGIPASWRARVVEDLERNVTAEKFPVWLPLDQAIELVRGRVREVLKPYEENKVLEAQRVEEERRKTTEQDMKRRAREREEAEEQRQIRQLIASGRTYAWCETLSWDPEDREDACEEISEVLENRVGADWSKDDVDELVDDILDKYDGED